MCQEEGGIRRRSKVFSDLQQMFEEGLEGSRVSLTDGSVELQTGGGGF